MRIPRDVSADQLIKALKKFGYFVSHRKGSHIRVTTIRNGQHHETIPNHTPSRSVRFQRYFTTLPSITISRSNSCFLNSSCSVNPELSLKANASSNVLVRLLRFYESTEKSIILWTKVAKNSRQILHHFTSKQSQVAYDKQHAPHWNRTNNPVLGGLL